MSLRWTATAADGDADGWLAAEVGHLNQTPPVDDNLRLAQEPRLIIGPELNLY